MITAWTSHLRGEDKKKFEDLIRNSMSTAVVDRLLTIIADDLERVDIETESSRQYDKANWSAYQAHCNGYRQAMRNIQKLFDLGEPK